MAALPQIVILSIRRINRLIITYVVEGRASRPSCGEFAYSYRKASAGKILAADHDG